MDQEKREQKKSNFVKNETVDNNDRDEPLTIFAPPLYIRLALASLRSRQPLHKFFTKIPTWTFAVRAPAA